MTGRFFAAYDALLARWPVPVEDLDVPSAYGTTRVHACGPREGPPLLLLHAGGATSTVWFANVAALSATHRVFAPDIINGPGRSVHNGAHPVRTVADLMAWLDALAEHLGLDRMDLAGHSYGGWIALRYALHAPDRVRRLALLDPTVCFSGLSVGYRLHAVPLLVAPSQRRARQFLAWETRGRPLDPGWLDVTASGAAEFRSGKVVIPHRPAASELHGLTVPTLVLLAGDSRTHDPARTAENARRLLPEVTATVLPGLTHHLMPTAEPQRLNPLLCTFLAASG